MELLLFLTYSVQERVRSSQREQLTRGLQGKGVQELASSYSFREEVHGPQMSAKSTGGHTEFTNARLTYFSVVIARKERKRQTECTKAEEPSLRK